MSKISYPDRVSLAHLPTAIEPLDRLSDFLGGPRILIKRDDQTGLAFGGNKTRKLEFLVAEALTQGCDHLVTTGGAHSNHCRQTAAAAVRLGLESTLVVRGSAPDVFTGNLLLNSLMGAMIQWAEDRSPEAVMEEVAAELKTAGKHPFIIPLGGSGVYGATGYVLAMEECLGQLADLSISPEVMVAASSSGGTQAGLTVGAKAFGYSGRVLGISIDHPGPMWRDHVEQLAIKTAKHLGLDSAGISELVEVNAQYLGEGLGIVGELEREAIRLLSRLEGILLDPVYTGRAMGALIDLIRRGRIGPEQTVLFWHTGGTPALFAYGEELLKP